MIMAYVKIAFAAAMMLAQPIHHDYDRGGVSDGVAVVSSRDVPSRPAQPASAQRSPTKVVQRVTASGGERPKPAAQARVAKQAAPNSREMPRAKVANWQPAGNAAAGADMKRTKIGESPITGVAAANANPRTIQEQVTAAVEVAERVTAAAAVAAPEKIAPAFPNSTDHLVAILMARPEIKSVSELAGKSIAIDNRQSSSNGSVRTAIAAAGAAEVQLSEGQPTAINRVASGEVPAAVLTLVSPEAAETFPEIAGFKIFRIPISPRSLKVREIER